MARAKRLQDSGIRKSTADLAKRLNDVVAAQKYVDPFRGDGKTPITSFDPLEKLAIMASDPVLEKDDPALIVRICSELAQYLYEKRKPTEPVAAQATQVIVNGARQGGDPKDSNRWVAQDFDQPVITTSRKMIAVHEEEPEESPVADLVRSRDAERQRLQDAFDNDPLCR